VKLQSGRASSVRCIDGRLLFSRARGPSPRSLILSVQDRRVRKLPLERLPVTQASTDELRPWRNDDLRGELLREETPQLRVMPTQLVAGAVTMSAYSHSQPLHFGDELLAAEPLQIVIHGNLS